MSTSGSQTISPTKTTTYILTCTQSGNTQSGTIQATQSTTVTVGSGNSEPFLIFSSSKIDWNTHRISWYKSSDLTSCSRSISPESNGTSHSVWSEKYQPSQVDLSKDSWSVNTSVITPTTYTLTCTGANSVTKTQSIFIDDGEMGPPPELQLTQVANCIQIRFDEGGNVRQKILRETPEWMTEIYQTKSWMEDYYYQDWLKDGQTYSFQSRYVDTNYAQNLKGVEVLWKPSEKQSIVFHEQPVTNGLSAPFCWNKAVDVYIKRVNSSQSPIFVYTKTPKNWSSYKGTNTKDFHSTSAGDEDQVPLPSYQASYYNTSPWSYYIVLTIVRPDGTQGPSSNYTIVSLN